MKVNDRGTMKWTSMMMPEQIDMLNKLWEEHELESMPEIDEQQMHENELVIQEALQEDLKVIIKHFADKEQKDVEGRLLYVDVFNKTLYIEGTEIKLTNIIEVSLL